MAVDGGDEDNVQSSVDVEKALVMSSGHILSIHISGYLRISALKSGQRDGVSDRSNKRSALSAYSLEVHEIHQELSLAPLEVVCS